MKNILLIALVLITFQLSAQPVGYYNGTEGKTGDELKSELNNIISGHMVWYYFYAKNSMLYSDADPSTPGNIITVYKGSSVDGLDYGTGGDFLNREHVWAKSHGQFGEDAPTGCDLHNLKPADGSVNISRSNKDFDNCQDGTQHSEATGCYYTSTSWEPRDEVKGDIARILFYMATRYEGENGEVDLEVNDQVDNSPDPFHGRLSALLEWNMQDLPDAFERNRNNVIFSFQQNRNPFIDNPEWVNMIWDGAAVNSISIADVAQSQALVFVGQTIDVSATVTGAGSVSVELHWGNTYTELTNTIAMTANGNSYTAQIPAQDVESDVYFSIVATDDNGTYNPLVYHYYVESIFDGTIQTIAEVQGEQASTPFADQEVTITGVVTGNFGDGFFVQDGPGAWNGVFVYDVLNPKIGDSIILTGTVTEYYELTEIVDVTDYYLISRGNDLPEAVILNINEVTEAYEGVLIRLQGVSCTNEDLGYGMWQVTDATGSMGIHNTPIYEIAPGLNTVYDIAGPCKWDYGEWKIELRDESDVLSGDHNAPLVSAINVVDAEKIMVVFNERLLESTAINTDNYSINNGVVVNQANESFPLSTIQLMVSNLTDGDYEMTISNVADISGNIMETQVVLFTASGIGIEGNSQDRVSVYPNPSLDGYISVSNAAQVNSVQVFDVAGKLLETLNNTNGNNTLRVKLPYAGVYFVHVMNDDNTQEIVKVIVE